MDGDVNSNLFSDEWEAIRSVERLTNAADNCRQHYLALGWELPNPLKRFYAIRCGNGLKDIGSVFRISD